MSFAKALLASIATCGYWFLILVLLYGAIAGDRNPELPPPTTVETYLVHSLIIVGGVIVYAGLLWLTVRIGCAAQRSEEAFKSE